MAIRITIGIMGIAIAFGVLADEPYTAEVIEVRSGYVLRVDSREGEHTVFLFGVVAPRTTEVEGRQAQRQAQALALGEQVTVVPRLEDGAIRYGDVLLPDGRNLAHELLRQGYVEWDRVRAPHNEYLEALETIGDRQNAARDSHTAAEMRDRSDTSGQPSRRQKDIESNYAVYRDEDGVLTIESKGAIDRETLIEQKRRFEAQKAAQREEELRRQLEREREYAATRTELQRQQAEARRQELERQEQLLELENQALRNQAQRIKNQQAYNPYPYRRPFIFPHSGFHLFPIVPKFSIRHHGVHFSPTAHHFGHPPHTPAPRSPLPIHE